MRKFYVVGRLTKDIEVKTKGDKMYCFGTVAVYAGKETTEFIDVTFFGKTAEIMGQYGKKGTSVAIEGNIHKNDKEHNYTLSLIGTTVTFLSKKE